MRFSGKTVAGFQSRKSDDACSWKNTDKPFADAKTRIYFQYCGKQAQITGKYVIAL